MKRLAAILILIAPLIAMSPRSGPLGLSFYCATNGLDSNPGTLAQPFLTWAKLVSVLGPGDTGFIRGGTYTSPVAPNTNDWLVTWQNKLGTPSQHITIKNYQNEVPILDLNGFVQNRNTTCLRINNCSYVDITGISIRNMVQTVGFITAGVEFHDCDHFTINNSAVFNIGGAGWRQSVINGSDTRGCTQFVWTNCDASWCADPVSTGGGAYGNADGYDANGVTTYINCRAWWNSDDGFDCFGNDSLTTYKGCWSFRNGYRPGTFSDPGPQADGMGFKWGTTTSNLPNTHLRTYTNCLSFDNKAWGFDQNVGRCIMWAYNNTSFRNKAGAFATGYGITPRIASIVKNNSSLQDPVQVSDPTGMTIANNSWQVAAATPLSFLSTDTTGTSGLRINGALPNLNFLKLSSTSNQIDQGIADANYLSLGLTFCGSAPDLGAYEFCNVQALNVSAAPAINPVSCFGNTTNVTVGVTGGTSPYQYKVGTGSFQSSNVFMGLGVGSYIFTVQDAVGNQASVSITINGPPQITISQSSGTITINGNTTTTTVTANGGTGTLQYKLDNGNFQTSNVFTGVPAGTHTITVRDASQCTNTLQYTLTQPSVLNVSAVAAVNPLPCSGSTTTITVTATGATPPYQYAINNGAFQAQNTFTNRPAGTYTLTVMDNAGATKTTTLTITAPPAITISESHTPILINGGFSTLTITAGGGTGTLQYSINSGQSFQPSNVFNNVAAGTYTVVVRDANLCTNAFTVTITQPGALGGSASTTNPLCFGGGGSIVVTGTGGTTPYQYRLNNGTLQSSNTFNGVLAGTYNVTIQDAGGAIFTFNATITAPAAITISENHTAILVNGGVSTLTVTSGGGTGAKQYSLDGGIFQSSNIFTNVPAGPHTITVRDVNNCTNQLQFTITQPTALTLNAAAGTILCNGGGTSASLTAAGGTPPYQYRNGTGPLQPSNIFNNLAAGTYQFTVQDANGAVSSTNLTINQPAPIIISLNAFTDAPATIIVSLTGGTSPFTYRLDGGSPQGSNTFNNVPAGNHTVIVTDANGCTGQKTFTVNNPVGITISFSPIVCNGGSTPVTIGGTGGVPPYTISGGSPQTKTAGTYHFQVSDSRGSIADSFVTINEPPFMVISENHTPILVNGGVSAVTISVVGGTGSKTYSLNGVTFQSSNVFNNVSAGNYIVTVKDANNCTNTFAFTVSQPGALSQLVSLGTISCSGTGATASTITGSGGTTPYTYSVDGGAYQVSNSFNALLAGTHTFSIKDAFGNISQSIQTISEPPAITISVTTGTILVNGGNTTVNAVGNGGTGSLQYSLDGGIFQGSGSFATVLAGPHTVTVKDGNNCTNFNTFTINQPGALGLSVALGTISCNGAGATASTITGSGGTTPYTYAVDGGSYQVSNSFSGLLGGSHTFSIKDAFGSIAQSIQNISQPAAIVLNVTTGTIIVNGGNTTVTGSATGGTGGLQYSLDGGAFQGSGTFTGVLAGPHTVTAKDGNNCTTINSFSISQPGVFSASVVFGANPVACYGNTTSMTITPVGGTAPYTITGGSPQTVGAGTYTVHVVDAFNVPFDTIVTVSQPSLISLVQTIYTPISSFGGTTDVTIQNNGGTPFAGPTYEYKLDGGGFVLSTDSLQHTFTAVSGGNHTVTVRDANGCTAAYQFFISQPDPPAQFQIRNNGRRIYRNSN